ncbi:MAG: hypothetical protein PHE51_01140 [Eubacteriales bacterium]|nr:hypothetical protein [Eubacteriales bacterium]
MATRRKKAPKSVTEYMETKSGQICKMLDDYLEEMSKPERVESAPLNQLASAICSLIEKFSKVSEGSSTGQIIELINALKQNGDDTTNGG